MAEKIYHGSCHCGKVTFAAKFDLAKGTFKCNCTICLKSRFWGASVLPEHFNLLTGNIDLKLYGKNVHHHFCKHCGVKVYGKANTPKGPQIAVAVTTLDDLDPVELSRAPVKFVDGRHDQFTKEPDFKGHL